MSSLELPASSSHPRKMSLLLCGPSPRCAWEPPLPAPPAPRLPGTMLSHRGLRQGRGCGWGAPGPPGSAGLQEPSPQPPRSRRAAAGGSRGKGALASGRPGLPPSFLLAPVARLCSLLKDTQRRRCSRSLCQQFEFDPFQHQKSILPWRSSGCYFSKPCLQQYSPLRQMLSASESAAYFTKFYKAFSEHIMTVLSLSTC